MDNWDYKIFNKIVNFFRKSIENGWIKDFLAWHGWGIVIVSIFHLVFLRSKADFELKLYSIFLVIIWIFTGIAIIDKAQDFSFKLIQKEQNRFKNFLFIISIAITIFILLCMFKLAGFLLKIFNVFNINCK
ncbi:MAG: hypothetical protein H0Z16_06460 [Thermodesulfobacterium sp.]|nr:hypothetical protein [Thermodesulfobacterium sp.]